MWIDPIVEEIREHRRAIAAEAGYDIDEICRRSHIRQTEMKDRVIKPAPPRDAWKKKQSPENLNQQ